MNLKFPGQSLAAPHLRYGNPVFLRRLLWLLVAFLALYHVAALLQFVVADHFYDFAHYYFYARNLIDGHRLFDLEAPKVLTKQLGIRYAEAPPVYSPPFYISMSPLALLPYHLAAFIWLLLNELLLFAALMWRGTGNVYRDPARMAFLSLVVLAFQPLYETLALGQVGLLLFAGVVLMIRLWAAGSLWCGVVLGLIMLIKPQFGALGLLWLRPPERRHLAVAVGTFCAIALGSLAVVGEGEWKYHLRYFLEFSCDRSLWALNFSVRGILFRLKGSCLADGMGDPMAVVATLIGIVVLCALAWYLWNHTPTDLPSRFRAVGLALCAIYLTSPYTQDHHLTLLLIVFSGLALDPIRPSGAARWGWLASYVLTATAYSLVQFPSMHLGWRSLLLAGKGLGVLLLGLVLATTAGHPRNHATDLLPPLLAAVGGARAAHAVLKAMIMGELSATLLSEIILAAGLLLSWFVMFRARFAKATA